MSLYNSSIFLKISSQNRHREYTCRIANLKQQDEARDELKAAAQNFADGISQPFPCYDIVFRKETRRQRETLIIALRVPVRRDRGDRLGDISFLWPSLILIKQIYFFLHCKSWEPCGLLLFFRATIAKVLTFYLRGLCYTHKFSPFVNP